LSNTEAALADAEQWAVSQGVTVINHSVAWFDDARGDGSGGPGTPDAIVADAAARRPTRISASSCRRR
jgi:hypothetical protein